jgi:hypothetical protein
MKAEQKALEDNLAEVFSNVEELKETKRDLFKQRKKLESTFNGLAQQYASLYHDYLAYKEAQTGKILQCKEDGRLQQERLSKEKDDIATVLRDVEAAHTHQITLLKSQHHTSAEKLTAKLEAATKATEKLQRQHASAIQQMQTDSISELENLEKINKSVKMEMEVRIEKREGALRGEIEDLINRARSGKNDYINQIDELKKLHNADVTIKTAQEEQIALLKKQIAKLKDENNLEVKQLNDAHGKSFAEELYQIKASHDIHVVNLKTAHEDQVGAIQSRMAKLAEDKEITMKRMKLEHEGTMKVKHEEILSLRTKAKEEAEELRRKHKQLLQNHKDAHAQILAAEMQRLTNVHEAAIQKKHEEMLLHAKAVKEEAELDISKLRAKHRNALESLASEHHLAHRSLADELHQTKANHDTHVINLKTAHEDQVGAIQSRMAKLAEDKEITMKRMKLEHESALQKKHNISAIDMKEKIADFEKKIALQKGAYEENHRKKIGLLKVHHDAALDEKHTLIESLKAKIQHIGEEVNTEQESDVAEKLLNKIKLLKQDHASALSEKHAEILHLKSQAKTEKGERELYYKELLNEQRCNYESNLARKLEALAENHGTSIDSKLKIINELQAKAHVDAKEWEKFREQTLKDDKGAQLTQLSSQTRQLEDEHARVLKKKEMAWKKRLEDTLNERKKAHQDHVESEIKQLEEKHCAMMTQKDLEWQKRYNGAIGNLETTHKNNLAKCAKQFNEQLDSALKKKDIEWEKHQKSVLDDCKKGHDDALKRHTKILKEQHNSALEKNGKEREKRHKGAMGDHKKEHEDALARQMEKVREEHELVLATQAKEWQKRHEGALNDQKKEHEDAFEKEVKRLKQKHEATLRGKEEALARVELFAQEKMGLNASAQVAIKEAKNEHEVALNEQAEAHEKLLEQKNVELDRIKTKAQMDAEELKEKHRRVLLEQNNLFESKLTNHIQKLKEEHKYRLDEKHEEIETIRAHARDTETCSQALIDKIAELEEGHAAVIAEERAKIAGLNSNAERKAREESLRDQQETILSEVEARHKSLVTSMQTQIFAATENERRLQEEHRQLKETHKSVIEEKHREMLNAEYHDISANALFKCKTKNIFFHKWHVNVLRKVVQRFLAEVKGKSDAALLKAEQEELASSALAKCKLKNVFFHKWRINVLRKVENRFRTEWKDRMGADLLKAEARGFEEARGYVKTYFNEHTSESMVFRARVELTK